VTLKRDGRNMTGVHAARATGPPDGYPDGFLDDYDALRHGAGARLVERDVIALSGPDARSYLQGQCSQDTDALAVGGSADALVLGPQGKVDALVRVTRTGDDDFVLDVEGGFGAALAERLERFKLRVKVTIDTLDWRCVAVRGPQSAPLAPARDGSGVTVPGVQVAPAFSWNGVEGFDLLGEGPEIPAGVRPCSVEAWEAVGVEAGIPVMGSELDERTIPAEADLLERCVSFTKGCYTGQELVARLDARGNKVARHLRGVVLDPSAGLSAGATRGATVERDGKTVGTITSAAWSPSTGGVVALAYVHRAVAPGDRVEVHPPDPSDAAAAPSHAATVQALPLEPPGHAG